MSDSQPEPTPLTPPPPGVLDRALALVDFLRANCPWDAAQTAASLERYLMEEAAEVVDAIESADDAALRDELGDLLLNLAFQIVLAEERGAFGREAVVSDLEDKMRRRHPHLYGIGDAESWDVLKSREREDRAAGVGGRRPLLADLPPGADPLQRAHRIQQRVAEVGFDWPDALGAWEKVREEVEEVGAELRQGRADEVAEEVGDLLFAVVNLARLAGVHSPTALTRANGKFIRRFTRVEELASERGVVVGAATLEALDELWDEAKREGR